MNRNRIECSVLAVKTPKNEAKRSTLDSALTPTINGPDSFVSHLGFICRQRILNVVNCQILYFILLWKSCSGNLWFLKIVALYRKVYCIQKRHQTYTRITACAK